MIGIFVAAFAAAVASPLCGAEAAKKNFDLPAEAAVKALKIFADQSKAEVLFLTEVTENVQTNAVKGEFTPRVAIDRMLAGTILVATENQRTGAFKIQRTHPLGDQRTAHDPGEGPRLKKKLTTSMNPPKS